MFSSAAQKSDDAAAGKRVSAEQEFARYVWFMCKRPALQSTHNGENFRSHVRLTTQQQPQQISEPTTLESSMRSAKTKQEETICIQTFQRCLPTRPAQQGKPWQWFHRHLNWRRRWELFATHLHHDSKSNPERQQVSATPLAIFLATV